ncbi:MAG: 6-phosphofructokinase [Deltaproteobacteria bacterium]|nr:6-phosphofructokinase [Deltaproteobacteria bacterium]MBW1871547.1 6-phosphofructokinase [Deltaproteobacteria bacterium]
MRIGVLTSGGDSPGMNAAIRTITAVGIGRNHEVIGIRSGFAGLLEGDTIKMDLPMVNGISAFGGTILGSARSGVFPTPDGQSRACSRIRDLDLDALVIIGGNGSLTGAHKLAEQKPCLIAGLPASIDNDIGHCGLAIGVDTAVNTIVEACDRISDTARAHRRAFIVEVMGRHCGFLAMRAGIAAEADAILYGEAKREEGELMESLRDVLRKCFSTWHKNRALIIKAEGVPVSTSLMAERLQEYLDEDTPGVDIRHTILGHVVRGGRPSAMDRVIAQRLAFGALLALEHGLHDFMMSWDIETDFGQKTPDPHIRIIPLSEALAETERLLNGTSEVTKGRMALLNQVEDLLFL